MRVCKVKTYLNFAERSKHLNLQSEFE